MNLEFIRVGKNPETPQTVVEIGGKLFTVEEALPLHRQALARLEFIRHMVKYNVDPHEQGFEQPTIIQNPMIEILRTSGGYLLQDSTNSISLPNIDVSGLLATLLHVVQEKSDVNATVLLAALEDDSFE